MTTELLNKLEKVIEDLYYDKRIISFTEKELADGTIEYTFVAKNLQSKKPAKQKVVIKKDKTEKDKTEKKESGPVKPPKPPMAEILSVGGY